MSFIAENWNQSKGVGGEQGKMALNSAMIQASHTLFPSSNADRLRSGGWLWGWIAARQTLLFIALGHDSLNAFLCCRSFPLHACCSRSCFRQQAINFLQ